MKSFALKVTVALSLSFLFAGASRADDGPYAVTSSGYYQFLNRAEPLVATDRNVDLWAQIYRPTDLTAKPYPLVVFLHGNHGTCGHYDSSLMVRVDDRSDYTTTGQCPPGYVVTPNHLGYAYMAEQLALWGYIVVSINANRGITAGRGLPDDRGLNLMRGRLVLRHLALLSDWTRGTGSITPPVSLGFNPVGSLDFSQVGLMGHSRGGEGQRAALQQFRDSGSPFPALIGPISIKSIFEIGPVDGQTSRVLDANGVYSNILLPACDGDVSNLQGIHVLDRVFLNTSPDTVQDFHSTTKVWGANHNAYNTEWLTSDSPGCAGTDPIFQPSGRSMPQQVTAREQLVPFFRATVGAKADLKLAGLFDPTNPIPSVITDIANVDRGYLPAPRGINVLLVEAFRRASGLSDGNVPNTAVGVSVVHQAASPEHYMGTRVATVSWTTSSPNTRYYQDNFADSRDVSAYKYFSFRTALRCSGIICERKATANGEMNYTVSLIDSNGQLTNAVSTGTRTRISRPIGDEQDNLHSDLYTVQVPMSLYRGVDKTHIKGVRFTFEKYQQGTVDVTDLAFLRNDPLADVTTTTSVASTSPAARVAVTPTSVAPKTANTAADGNTIRVVRQVAASQKTAAAPTTQPTTNIVLTSKRSFPFSGALPKLTVGTATIEGGDVDADGKTMTISVPSATFDKLPAGANVSLSVQASSPVWQFGALPK